MKKDLRKDKDMPQLLFEGLIAIEKKEYSSMEDVFEEIEKKFFKQNTLKTWFKSKIQTNSFIKNLPLQLTL